MLAMIKVASAPAPHVRYGLGTKNANRDENEQDRRDRVEPRHCRAGGIFAQLPHKVQHASNPARLAAATVANVVVWFWRRWSAQHALVFEEVFHRFPTQIVEGDLGDEHINRNVVWPEEILA